MRLRRTIAAVVLLAAAGCGADDAHATADETIAAIDGASLTRVTFSDGSHAYLQLIDLLRVRVQQVTGGVDASSEAGRYYPGVASPRFTRIPPGPVQNGCFSLVNFSFFEEYDPGTRLSFPVKSGGTVMTGGSSPYGPVAAPADPYYRTVTLQALTWKDLGAAIAPYDPARGTPLDTGEWPDGLVTYRYQDHPSYVLSHDPPNRYQLLALTETKYLLIVTVEHATLDTAADLLRTHGAVGEILAFDGGVSTYLWQASLGELVPITNADGKLPHYLCVRPRPAQSP
jgi:hypothetical protein